MTDEPSNERERVQPEILVPAQFLVAQSQMATAADGENAAEAAGDDSEQVTRPTKLIRIASMVRSMLEVAAFAFSCLLIGYMGIIVE